MGAGCHLDNSECDGVSGNVARDVGDTDGIEGVGDREDSRSKGDESPPDAVWVARSVPSLMVVGYENGRFPEEEERFEQRGTKPRVILHGDIGFWIELVRSDGQLAREHQEPDIVEEGCEL